MTEKEAIEELLYQEDMRGEGLDYQVNNLVIGKAVKALEEIQQYRAIGTVEECRAALEKQVPKKPLEYENKYYACPNCDNVLMHKWEKYPSQLMDKRRGLPYCLGCGQAILWETNEEH